MTRPDPTTRAAIAAAVFPEGVPEMAAPRRLTPFELTKQQRDAGVPLQGHGEARRNAYIARVEQRRGKAKARKQMVQASKRRNRGR